MIDPDSRTALRRRLREQRSALPAASRLAASLAIAQHLTHYPCFTSAARVAGYWAVRAELPLAHIPASLRQRDAGYFLPLLSSGQTLRFAAWKAGDAIVANRYGIPEPDVAAEAQLAAQDIDLILLPLVAFDRSGQRLGSGAGYYDRTLEFLRDRAEPSTPRLVGVAYAMQELPAIDHAPWDVPLDAVVTEAGIIDCWHGRAGSTT